MRQLFRDGIAIAFVMVSIVLPIGFTFLLVWLTMAISPLFWIGLLLLPFFISGAMNLAQFGIEKASTL